jgi:hypothetical protein
MNDDSADPVEPTPLVRAREMIEEWAAYADEYFREKWDLAGDLAEIDRAIEAEARASAEQPIPSYPDREVPHDPATCLGCGPGTENGPSAEKPAVLPDDEDYETCPTCMRPMPIPERGDHDYGLRLTRADQPAQTTEVERLREALTELALAVVNGYGSGSTARNMARRALDEANRG